MATQRTRCFVLLAKWPFWRGLDGSSSTGTSSTPAASANVGGSTSPRSEQPEGTTQNAKTALMRS